MNFSKYTKLFGIICGSLVMGLPSISQVAKAQETVQQPTSKVNPCPRIFYEEPHNNRVLVPVGCPPNALTLKLMELGVIPYIITPYPGQSRLGMGGLAPSPLNPNPSIFYEPPYNRSSGFLPPVGSVPSQVSALPTPPTTLPETTTIDPTLVPSTRIALANGKADITLKNNTNAEIIYQVIGDTQPRILSGMSNVTLRDLSTPATVTFQRDDGGLLMVETEPGRKMGSLEVTLEETTDINQDRNSMRIQSNGSVFLN
jgi:hypothetical protein